MQVLRRIFLLTLLGFLYTTVHGQDAHTDDRPESLLFEVWDQGSWTASYSEDYGYTYLGDPSDTSRSIRLNSGWYLDWRTQVFFNDQNYRTQLKRQLFEEPNWQDLWRWDITYDEENYLATRTYLRMTMDGWQEEQRIVNTYDLSGGLHAEVYQVWLGGEWLNDIRYVRDYTDWGDVSLLTEQRWNYDNDLWEELARETFGYDVLGKPTLWQRSYLDQSVWLDEWRVTWNYDTSGVLAFRTLEVMMNGSWLNSQRRVYIYDWDGQVSAITHQDWDYEELAWLDDLDQTYTYDLWGRTLQRIDQYWDLETGWVPESRSSWTYAEPSRIDVVLTERFTLAQNYPNPFNPSTTLSFSLAGSEHVELTVFDIRGGEVVHLVNETLPAGQHQFQWDGRDQQQNLLEAGVYIARLTVQGHTRSIKMLLLR